MRKLEFSELKNGMILRDLPAYTDGYPDKICFGEIYNIKYANYSNSKGTAQIYFYSYPGCRYYRNNSPVKSEANGGTIVFKMPVTILDKEEIALLNLSK